MARPEFNLAYAALLRLTLTFPLAMTVTFVLFWLFPRVERERVLREDVERPLLRVFLRPLVIETVRRRDELPRPVLRDEVARERPVLERRARVEAERVPVLRLLDEPDALPERDRLADLERERFVERERLLERELLRDPERPRDEEARDRPVRDAVRERVPALARLLPRWDRPPCALSAVSRLTSLLKLLFWPPAVSSCTRRASALVSNLSNHSSQEISSSESPPL